MYQTLLCDAMSFNYVIAMLCHFGTPKYDKFLTLLMPYSAKIRIFVLCFVRGLLCSGGNL